MLDFYFQYPGVLRRLRNGALGKEMDRIAAHFFDIGYKRASAKIYIGCAKSLKATSRFHRIRTAIFIESGHPFS